MNGVILPQLSAVREVNSTLIKNMETEGNVDGSPTPDTDRSKTQSVRREDAEHMREKSSVTIDFSKLDNMLECEKITSRKESWNKLEKGLKIQKLCVFAEVYCKKHNIRGEVGRLQEFLTDAIGKKKLCKVKDVVYDKGTGCITNIPPLFVNNSTRSFTLRNTDKSRISTLKSLAPTRTHGLLNSEIVRNKILPARNPIPQINSIIPVENVSSGGGC